MSLTPQNIVGTSTMTNQMVVEPSGNIDVKKGSAPKAPTTADGLNPAVLDASKKLKSAILSKKGTDYSVNSGVGTETREGLDDKDNAVKRAKAKKAKKNTKNTQPDNPTAASQPKDKSIHDASLAADPKNIVGSVQKALQAMIALKMMDQLTSPGGVSNMVSGALGNALQNVASQLGLSNVLKALSSEMPDIVQPLNSSGISILNQAITSMINGTSIGALSSSSILSSQNIINALTEASTGSNITTIANIGGPALGLDADTLASKIAQAAIGEIIVTLTNINGVNVESTVNVSASIQNAVGNIPILNGTEAVNIALGEVPNLIASITSMINNNNISQLGPLINATTNKIVDMGLQAILGSGINDMLSNVQNILPNLAGNILGTMSSHLPKTVLDQTKIKNVMNQATKVMGLGQMAFKIANIFNASLSEQDQSLNDALANQVSSMIKGSVLSIVSASGSTIIVTNKG